MKNGIVVDVIIVDDLQKFYGACPDYCATFDAMIPVSDEPGSPGAGWSYDGKSFVAPDPGVDG